MRTVLMALAVSFVPVAFANTSFIACTPTAGTNAGVLGSAIDFNAGSGTGSFACSDASLGSITLSAVNIEIFTDYQFGNGQSSDPTDNSAGFTFTNGATTWSALTAGVSTTTMSLNGGVTLFVVGNLSSQADTFTNTTSGGLGGTGYAEPAVDNVTGTLLDNYTVPVTAFVDAGGFTSGASVARVTVEYTYTQNTTPEPATMMLIGSGLLAVAALGRKRFAKK